MHLHTRNVNTAFNDLVRLFAYPGERLADKRKFDYKVVKKSSRNGSVMLIDEPVMVTYSHPKERVLFNAARDASPFLHLYESLWMLAGRNDLAPLKYYTKQFENYSDDGKTLNGAYGYRWRKSHVRNSPRRAGPDAMDQLDILVNHLKADPDSRRAVLQMWNVEDDLLKIGSPCTTCAAQGSSYFHPNWYTTDCPTCQGKKLVGQSRDVCCNLSVMFSIRHVDDGTMRFKERREDPLVPIPGTEKMGRQYLDMTVTNRSNDMIWGMLGANAVHFSFLQEYMAARLGVEVGVYNQFTNNLHVYENNWKPEEWLAYENYNHFPDCLYRMTGQQNPGELTTVPLIKDPVQFEKELSIFVDQFHNNQLVNTMWDEPFLADVAFPVLMAFNRHKEKASTALSWAEKIKADDWRIAATQWLQRRINKKEKV